MHATMQKFGYPARLIREYEHWALLLRPAQITLGSCVICIKDDIRTVGEAGPAAFAEYAVVTQEIEAALYKAFAYDKINYLCLMMVDPQVHTHVVPRYEMPRAFEGATFTDAGWPNPPQLKPVLDLSLAQMDALQKKIIACM